jgi:superfamily II RNA helicase
MAGRAGRRGMDPEGFVYVRVNPEHVSLPELHKLLHGDPEPVHSRFNTAYATLLNLYREHGRRLLALYPRTLYHYQTTGARRQEGLELLQRKLELLTALGYLTGGGLTRRGEFAAWLYGYELLLTELQFAGHLSALDPLQLALLLAAQVYEPRPTAGPPKRHRLSQRLQALCQGPLERIHREEHRRRISPRTKSPAFHLSHAVEAWMSRAPFARLSQHTDVDEGELVRYFRMTVQLLRQLGELPGADAGLRANARKAMERINRDVVDAEAQLRLG